MTARLKRWGCLDGYAVFAKSNTIEIPFNRQELADFLCVDRSALSRELGAMQSEGLINYSKNSFELIRPESGW